MRWRSPSDASQCSNGGRTRFRLLDGRIVGEASSHFDLAHDGSIERRQVFGRDPIFPVLATSRYLDLIFIQEGLGYLKGGYVAAATRRHIPVSGNFDGICFRGYGIEDRLLGKSRRKGLHVGCLD